MSLSRLPRFAIVLLLVLGSSASVVARRSPHPTEWGPANLDPTTLARVESGTDRAGDTPRARLSAVTTHGSGNATVTSAQTGRRGLRRVRGRIQDRQGRPVAHAIVRVDDRDFFDLSRRAPPSATVTADEDGVFELVLQLYQPTVLTATAPGLLTLRPASYGFRPCGMMHGIDLESDEMPSDTVEPIVLAAEGILEGCVRTLDGAPLRASVTIRGSSSAQRLWMPTDKSGRFRASVPDDTYSISASAEGFVEESLRVDFLTGDPELELRLVPKAILRGRLAGVTGPLSKDVRIEVRSTGPENQYLGSASSGASVEFEIDGFDGRGGAVDLLVYGGGITGRERVPVRPGINETVVTVSPAPYLTGVLLDGEGRPVPDEHIALREPKFQDGGSVLTDAEGRFKLAAYHATFDIELERSFGKNIPLARGIVMDASDVELTLTAPAFASLSARFVTENGRTIAPYSVRGVGGGFGAEAREGRFNLARVPVGTYWVVASGCDFERKGDSDVSALERLDVKPGLNEVLITLVPVGSVLVRVVGPDGQALPDAPPLPLVLESLDCGDFTETSRDDGPAAPQFKKLPAGRYRVRVAPDGLGFVRRQLREPRLGAEAVEVTVPPGETATTTLRLRLE